ncbi:hypothetical protein RJ641_034281 [Dillenia turbinata]|uniref:Uncharacterized protein n=1 Tax=Dillenia turbinata TaxID=194707 RepID=A0AAN8ZDI3_9MAGN
MKSAYRSVMFYTGQKEPEMQFKINRIVVQCKQKCDVMQDKFTEKLEQVHTAYQKMVKSKRVRACPRISRSSKKNLLRNTESTKRSVVQPANSFYAGNEQDLFTNPVNKMDNRDPIRKDWSMPETPGRQEEIWPPERTVQTLVPLI